MMTTMMMMMGISWVFPGFYSADTRLKEHRDAMAVVNYEGNVLWLPAAIFRSTCPVNILYFPFDIQVCILKFGSWTYDGWKLDVNFHEDVGDMVSKPTIIGITLWHRCNKLSYRKHADFAQICYAHQSACDTKFGIRPRRPQNG